MVKSKEKGKDSLHYLVFGPTVQLLSTPWADSTLLPSVKVNCLPMGNSSLCTRHRCFSKIDFAFTCTYSTVDLFILDIYMSKPIWNQKQ